MFPKTKSSQEKPWFAESSPNSDVYLLWETHFISLFNFIVCFIFIFHFIRNWCSPNQIHDGTLVNNDLSAENSANAEVYAVTDYEDDDDRACAPHMFRCENSPCIPEYLKCNGVVDCPFDISDELDCDDLDNLRKSYEFHVPDTHQRWNVASSE